MPCKSLAVRAFYVKDGGSSKRGTEAVPPELVDLALFARAHEVRASVNATTEGQVCPEPQVGSFPVSGLSPSHKASKLLQTCYLAVNVGQPASRKQVQSGIWHVFSHRLKADAPLSAELFTMSSS